MTGKKQFYCGYENCKRDITDEKRNGVQKRFCCQYCYRAQIKLTAYRKSERTGSGI